MYIHRKGKKGRNEKGKQVGTQHITLLLRSVYISRVCDVSHITVRSKYKSLKAYSAVQLPVGIYSL